MKSAIIFFAVVVLLSCRLSKQGIEISKKSLTDSLTIKLNTLQQQGFFNGFSVAIVNDREILYKHGIGYANKETGKKYTQNTIQNIGSVSKTFIGIALMKAQEMGMLKLDDPINKYLPFKVANPAHPNIEITIKQLATHTSSITDNEFYLKKNYILKPNQDLKKFSLLFGEDDEVLNPFDSAISMKNFLENALSAKGKWNAESYTKNKPGAIFEYSNVGATLAAYVLEMATGKTFDSFTKEYIFTPLKMNNTGWKFADINFSNHSTLYKNPREPLPFYSLITYPDGNLITSLTDLSKYLTELMKGYEGNGSLLTIESYDMLFKQQLTAVNFVKRNEKNPYNDSYNSGIFMGFSVAGNIGHTGGDPGVASMMFFNPTTKIGRIIITNTNLNNKEGNKPFIKFGISWKNIRGGFKTLIFFYNIILHSIKAK